MTHVILIFGWRETLPRVSTRM